MSFDNLGLSEPLLKAIADLQHTTPSEIQSRAIPVILEGKDVMAAAQTGTGKTASFILPVVELLSRSYRPNPKRVHALVLTPTRELAHQVNEHAHSYGKYTEIKSAAVYGGAPIFQQKTRLKKGVSILVATPGRLLDLIQQDAVSLRDVKMLILDEADRMLDMGFIDDIKKINGMTPANKQSLLFSATFTDDIIKLSKAISPKFEKIVVKPEVRTLEAIQQIVMPVDKEKKSALLVHLIKEQQWFSALVFTKTKHGADKLEKILNAAKIRTTTIHGNKSQGARMKALKGFKDNQYQVLVATDVAARGIDIKLLPYVVNYDLPMTPNDYVHRIGRTGRAGEKGIAISLVSAEDYNLLRDIEKQTQQKIDIEVIEGFEPQRQPSKAKPATSKNSRSRGKSSGNSKSKVYAERRIERRGPSERPAGRSRPEGERTYAPAGRSRPEGERTYAPAGRSRPSSGPSERPAGRSRPEGERTYAPAGRSRPSSGPSGRPGGRGKPQTPR
jgi:ATP-dependent RNA helicase RhlE